MLNTMGPGLKNLGIFVLCLFLGTLYAGLVGLSVRSLAGPLISWPIWIALFWFAFRKFDLFRFTGFIAALPMTLLVFEVVRSIRQPGFNADLVRSFDRSRYTPGFRVKNPKFKDHVNGPKEILIGGDGFRADPDTGRGNPESCRFALIGDSMIYGTGLAYRFTLGPVLSELGVPACVLGITGNSPLDYLSTLKYVADRLEPGAYVALYVYAGNDFVNLNKLIKRGVLVMSDSFHKLFEWAFYFDRWRYATWTYSLFRGEFTPPPKAVYEYEFGKGHPMTIISSRNPAAYVHPKPLTRRQRAAFRLFLDRLHDLVKSRPWRVLVLLLPNDSEIYANFARRSPVFVDLDPRRAEALKMCQDFSFHCEDISRTLYQRSLTAGKNPYLDYDNHFSPFGNRIIAEHFVTLTARGPLIGKSHGS
jgi:hypothetical protein